MNPQVPYAQPGYGQPPPPYPGTTSNPVPQVTGFTHCIFFVSKAYLLALGLAKVSSKFSTKV
jgi:hypothetical protein